MAPLDSLKNGVRTKLDPALLLGEIVSVLREMPPLNSLRELNAENMSWTGCSLAVIEAWDGAKVIPYEVGIAEMRSSSAHDSYRVDSIGRLTFNSPFPITWFSDPKF